MIEKLLQCVRQSHFEQDTAQNQCFMILSIEQFVVTKFCNGISA